jgi:large conductance mechanosensitive channel
MQAWLREFKTFILRGNLVELAVAFVIGVAFAALVTALVADMITPIIAAIFGSHDFSNLVGGGSRLGQRAFTRTG